MGKQSGLGDAFFLDGYDLSGDVGSISTSGGPSPLAVTGIDKLAPERIGGRRTGAMSWSSWFNPAAAREHVVLRTLPVTNRTGMYCRGTSAGAHSANLVGKQLNYDPTVGSDGSLTIKVDISSDSYGLEWGQLITAGKRTDTTATNGTDVLDGGATTAFGLQAYLHVFAFTGTSFTAKLQESQNVGGSPDTWADVVGGGFAAASAIGSQRIATAANLSVERYLRLVTTGTFSNAVFAVSVCRNLTTPVF